MATGYDGYADYAGVFGGDTLLAKAKCKYTSVPVDENGAVTNKKEVVCRICDHSLADSRPRNTMNLFYHLQANHPEEHSEVIQHFMCNYTLIVSRFCHVVSLSCLPTSNLCLLAVHHHFSILCVVGNTSSLGMW